MRHRDERLAAVIADLVDRRDVWMIERAGGARLAQQAGRGFRTAGRFRLQKLERHPPSEVRVLSQIHRSHPAGADAADDPVMGDDGADHCVTILLLAPFPHRAEVSGAGPNSPTRGPTAISSRHEGSAEPRRVLDVWTGYGSERLEDLSLARPCSSPWYRALPARAPCMIHLYQTDEARAVLAASRLRRRRMMRFTRGLKFLVAAAVVLGVGLGTAPRPDAQVPQQPDPKKDVQKSEQAKSPQKAEPTGIA